MTLLEKMHTCIHTKTQPLMAKTQTMNLLLLFTTTTWKISELYCCSTLNSIRMYLSINQFLSRKIKV